ncbi:MAG: hypothetical protein ACETWQ_18815 [Phycisphaerae bacterium]
MAKHEKNKAGLQKEISSIFKGVSVPQKNGDREPSDTSAPERADYIKPKPPVPDLQKTEVPKAYQATQTLPKGAPEHTGYTEPKQPTPEPQKPQAQKSYQVTPSLPKAAPARQPKTELTQQTKAKPVHLPEFMKDQQSDVEPAQRPKVIPVQQSKAEPVQKTKVVPAQKPKADIDKKVSKKRPIVKISSLSFWQQIKGKLFQPKPGVSTAKQKAMVVMMPLLFIVLIFMLFRGGVFGTSAGHTEASTEDTASGVGTAGANNKIDWEIPAQYPTTLRDPMQLVPVEVPQAKQTETRKTIEIIVKSILYSEDNPSAVISGRILHEGEKIRNVSIIKISKDTVEFEMNGKRWTQKVQ